RDPSRRGLETLSGVLSRSSAPREAQPALEYCATRVVPVCTSLIRREATRSGSLQPRASLLEEDGLEVRRPVELRRRRGLIAARRSRTCANRAPRAPPNPALPLDGVAPSSSAASSPSPSPEQEPNHRECSLEPARRPVRWPTCQGALSASPCLRVSSVPRSQGARGGRFPMLRLVPTLDPPTSGCRRTPPRRLSSAPLPRPAPAPVQIALPRGTPPPGSSHSPRTPAAGACDRPARGRASAHGPWSSPPCRSWSTRPPRIAGPRHRLASRR